MTAFLDSAELDFTAYRNKLKDFLKGQDKFKDYDFDGPNMAVMLDLLARNTYHNGFYLNMVGSEMFLDSAILREPVVSHAKELNYLPRSRISAKTFVDIAVFPTDNPSLITIPKFYSVSAGQSGDKYMFSTNQIVVVRNSGGQYIARNVEIFEGRVVTEAFIANTSTRFVISSPNIDTSSIEVNVQNSISDTANTNWTRAPNLYGVGPTSNVYFLQGVNSDQYEVMFGNDNTGRAISVGNIVRVRYRDTVGIDGNGLSRFTPVSNVDGYTNVSIAMSAGATPSFGGAEREGIDSIKFNAPRHFSAQERAVTAADYVALVEKAFPNIETISVFGGEDLPQKRYGRTVLSIKPFGQDFATEELKSRIATYLLDKSSRPVSPLFVDPDYFFVGVNTEVNYDKDATNKSSTDIEKDVMNAIISFGQAKLRRFSADYLNSQLSTDIDDADGSIVSNTTSALIAKRIAPLPGVETTLTVRFAAALDTTAREPAVKSSLFTYTINNNEYIAAIRDDSQGLLQIFTTDSDGNEVVLVPNIGTVDYTTGVVQINKIMLTYNGGYVSIWVRTASKDFKVKRNQILIIDPADCIISPVPVNTSR